jgi:hypothetical protein
MKFDFSKLKSIEVDEEKLEAAKSFMVQSFCNKLQVPKSMLAAPQSISFTATHKSLTLGHCHICGVSSMRRCKGCGRLVCDEHFHSPRCIVCVSRFAHAVETDSLDLLFAD